MTDSLAFLAPQTAGPAPSRTSIWNARMLKSLPAHLWPQVIEVALENTRRMREINQRTNQPTNLSRKELCYVICD